MAVDIVEIKKYLLSYSVAGRKKKKKSGLDMACSAVTSWPTTLIAATIALKFKLKLLEKPLLIGFSKWNFTKATTTTTAAASTSFSICNNKREKV